MRQSNMELERCVPTETDYNPRLASSCGCYLNMYKCRPHMDDWLNELRVKSAKTKNPRSAEEGTEYAFTLTMPPDYQPKIPLTEVAKKVLEFGLTSKPYQKATKYAYVLEHTASGTPHIHGVYQTLSGRRISSKYFNRYWPLWDEKVKLGNGHKGGYHQKARHSESYAAYLEKEGVVQKGTNLPEPEPESDNPDIISHV